MKFLDYAILVVIMFVVFMVFSCIFRLVDDAVDYSLKRFRESRNRRPVETFTLESGPPGYEDDNGSNEVGIEGDSTCMLFINKDDYNILNVQVGEYCGSGLIELEDCPSGLMIAYAIRDSMVFIKSVRIDGTVLEATIDVPDRGVFNMGPLLYGH